MRMVGKVHFRISYRITLLMLLAPLIGEGFGSPFTRGDYFFSAIISPSCLQISSTETFSRPKFFDKSE